MDNEKATEPTTAGKIDLDAVRSSVDISAEDINLPDSENEDVQAERTTDDRDKGKDVEDDDIVDFAPSDDDEEDTVEDDENLENFDKYQFDEKVLEGLPKDKADAVRERWKQQAAGLIKAEQKLAQEREEFQKNEQELTVYRSWMEDFSNPQTAAQTCVNMLNQVAEVHKVDIVDLLEAMGVANLTSGRDDDDGYSPSSYRQNDSDVEAIVRKAVQEAVKPLQEELDKRKQQEQAQTWIKSQTDNVNSYFKQFGIRFSEKQVQEAVSNVPSLRDQPRKAVEKWFGADIERIKAQRKAKSDTKSKPPSLARASAGVEESPYDPAELSFEEIAHRMVSRNKQRSS